MPEIANVVAGNTIESSWGNAIRDRTVQRYATAAARTAAHPTPTDGDLSYLQDSDAVEIYYSGAWRPLGISEVDGSAEVAGAVALGAAASTAATVNLTIPTGWASWSCFAYATFRSVAATASESNGVRIQIDGTDRGEQIVVGPSEAGAVGGHRTGMTTTGARTVLLRARENIGTGGQLTEIFLYARAVRTS